MHRAGNVLHPSVPPHAGRRHAVWLTDEARQDDPGGIAIQPSVASRWLCWQCVSSVFFAVRRNDSPRGLPDCGCGPAWSYCVRCTARSIACASGLGDTPTERADVPGCPEGLKLVEVSRRGETRWPMTDTEDGNTNSGPRRRLPMPRTPHVGYRRSAGGAKRWSLSLLLVCSRLFPAAKRLHPDTLPNIQGQPRPAKP